MKTTAKKAKTLKFDVTNALEKHVAEWLQERASDYSNGVNGVVKDLFYGGCQSGYVNHLIYSHDCREFVAKYMIEIQELVTQFADETGDTSFLFDKDTGFTFDRLAWIAFEETARKIADNNGIEV